MKDKKTVIINSVIIGAMLVATLLFTVLINNLYKKEPAITTVYAYVYLDEEENKIMTDFLGEVVVLPVVEGVWGEGSSEIKVGDIVEFVFEGDIRVTNGNYGYLRVDPVSTVIKKRDVVKTFSGDDVLLSFAVENSMDSQKNYAAAFYAEDSEKVLYSAVIDSFDSTNVTIRFNKSELVTALKAVSVYNLTFIEN